MIFYNDIVKQSKHSRKYPAHVEHLGVKIRQIRHDENEDRFNDPDFMGEPGHETCSEAPHHADAGATDSHHEKGRQPRQKVCVDEIGWTHFPKTNQERLFSQWGNFHFVFLTLLKLKRKCT